MKKISDYNFSIAWQANKLKLNTVEEYAVPMDLGDLKKGDLLKFAGFDDVANHFGIFVFTDQLQFNDQHQHADTPPRYYRRLSASADAGHQRPA